MTIIPNFRVNRHISREHFFESMKLILAALVAQSILFSVSGIGSAVIFPLDKYVIDTGGYAMSDIIVSKLGPDYEYVPNAAPIYVEGISYHPGGDQTIAITVREFRNATDCDHTLALFDDLGREGGYQSGTMVKVSKPYPGIVSAMNSTVFYFGKVSQTVILVIETKDIDLANYLIQSVRVYPKNQENALVAAEAARGLE